MDARKYFLLLGFLAGIVSPTLAAASPTREDSAQVGTDSLLLASGFKIEDYKGRIVLLNFWATYCPPCREEIPDLIRLRDHFDKDRIAIIGISVDRGELEPLQAKLKTFITHYKINYPILLDRDLDLVRLYGDFNQVPTSFLIDAGGKLVRTYQGAQKFEEFSADIQDLLNGTN